MDYITLCRFCHPTSASKAKDAPGNPGASVSYAHSAAAGSTAAAAAATAIVVAVAAPAAVAAAAPNDDQQNDNPAAITATKTIITHTETS